MKGENKRPVVTLISICWYLVWRWRITPVWINSHLKLITLSSLEDWAFDKTASWRWLDRLLPIRNGPLKGVRFVFNCDVFHFMSRCDLSTLNFKVFFTQCILQAKRFRDESSDKNVMSVLSPLAISKNDFRYAIWINRTQTMSLLSKERLPIKVHAWTTCFTRNTLQFDILILGPCHIDHSLLPEDVYLFGTNGDGIGFNRMFDTWHSWFGYGPLVNA